MSVDRVHGLGRKWLSDRKYGHPGNSSLGFPEPSLAMFPHSAALAWPAGARVPQRASSCVRRGGWTVRCLLFSDSLNVTGTSDGPGRDHVR